MEDNSIKLFESKQIRTPWDYDPTKKMSPALNAYPEIIFGSKTFVRLQKFYSALFLKIFCICQKFVVPLHPKGLNKLKQYIIVKKILSFFAIAALVLGMASCNGNDPVDPQKDAPFRITFSDVTCDKFTVTITPNDKEAEYGWGYAPVPWLELMTKNGNFNPSSQIEDYVLSKYFQGRPSVKGDIIKDGLFAYPNTEYIVFVYQWDEENEKVVIWATQKFTTLIPDGFVDLGLPSGNLWSCDYVLNNNGEGNYMTYSEMFDIYNDAPSWFYRTEKSDWEELRDKCTWKYYTNLFEVTNDSRYDGKNGYQVTGPSGQSIYLPFMGGKNLNGTLSDLGYTGNYWVYTQSENDITDYCYLTTGSNFFKMWTVNKNCSMSACFICPSYLDERRD